MFCLECHMDGIGKIVPLVSSIILIKQLAALYDQIYCSYTHLAIYACAVATL